MSAISFILSRARCSTRISIRNSMRRLLFESIAETMLRIRYDLSRAFRMCLFKRLSSHPGGRLFTIVKVLISFNSIPDKIWNRDRDTDRDTDGDTDRDTDRNRDRDGWGKQGRLNLGREICLLFRLPLKCRGRILCSQREESRQCWHCARKEYPEYNGRCCSTITRYCVEEFE